jgi:glycine cleavage system H protein
MNKSMADVKRTVAEMQFPAELKYYKEHTWVKVEGDTAWVGITDFAQDQLGAIIFIELPQVDDVIVKGQQFGSAESVKTVSALFAPVSGRIIAVNRELEDKPELVNEAPYEAGWMLQVASDKAEELNELLSPEGYIEILK